MFRVAVPGVSSSGRALLIGTALLVVALAVLLIALAERSTLWLVAAAGMAGASQGLGFRAALATVAAATPVPDRGSVTSAFFAVAYVGGIPVPVLGVGISAEQLGLVRAGEAFVAVIGSVAIGALVRLCRERRWREARGVDVVRTPVELATCA